MTLENIGPILIGLFAVQISLTGITLAFMGFMWNRIDKRFDKIEEKLDKLVDNSRNSHATYKSQH